METCPKRASVDTFEEGSPQKGHERLVDILTHKSQGVSRCTVCLCSLLGVAAQESRGVTVHCVPVLHAGCCSTRVKGCYGARVQGLAGAGGLTALCTLALTSKLKTCQPVGCRCWFPSSIATIVQDLRGLDVGTGAGGLGCGCGCAHRCATDSPEAAGSGAGEVCLSIRNSFKTSWGACVRVCACRCATVQPEAAGSRADELLSKGALVERNKG
eukprot:1158615-Pelagomonas_calceolata.AAC.2